MELLSVLEANAIQNKMIMQMLAVDVRCNEDFAIAELLCKFASDLVNDLRLDVFIG